MWGVWTLRKVYTSPKSKRLVFTSYIRECTKPDQRQGGGGGGGGGGGRYGGGGGGGGGGDGKCFK